MTNSIIAGAPARILEDPLSYLPRVPVTAFEKGSTIYGPGHFSDALMLIVAGRVKVCRISDQGRPVVVDVYFPDEFFGESALAPASRDGETAVALDEVTVMSWTVGDIEELAARRPQLAVALLQLVAGRSVDFGRRIESFAVDNIARRLARGLIRFSERMEQHSTDAPLQMIPFTHELLSQYVGTSREIVTHYMNEFRRQGFLRYSRKGIMVRRDVLQDWLGSEAVAA